MIAAITIYVLSDDLSFFPADNRRPRYQAPPGNSEPMSQTALYPLRFEPIYQYRLWGGRRLASLLPHRCRATDLSAKRGYSVTAMTIRAALPMDP